MYRQVLLFNKLSIDLIYTVAWIPEKFAQLDKKLKLKDDNGNWIEGWIVKALYNFRPVDYIFAHERDWVKQREASDI